MRIMMEHGSQLVNQAILRLLNIRFGPYICSDVVEFGDESMFNDVNGNLRQDDHQDIGEQHPQVVWGENGTRNFVICRKSHAWNIFFGGECTCSSSLLWTLSSFCPTHQIRGTTSLLLASVIEAQPDYQLQIQLVSMLAVLIVMLCSLLRVSDTGFNVLTPSHI